MIVHPEDAFRRLRTDPSWLLVFVLTTASTAGFSIAVGPYVEAAAVGRSAGHVGLGDLVEIHQAAETWTTVRAVGAPLAVMVRWLMSSTLLWLWILAVLGRDGFSRALSLTAHVGVIAEMGRWAGWVALKMRGVEWIRATGSVEPRLGLDALMRSDDPAVNALLGQVNPFALWQVALLAVGVATVFRCRPGWAAGVAGAFWISTLALRVGVASVAALLS